MKIFCIGRNYAEHAAELNNPLPQAPVVFMKPPTALLSGGKPFYLPDFSENMHYEGELVLRLGKGGRSVNRKFALGYIDAVTVGVDWTARDLQDKQKAGGLPWEIAKAFDHSAVIGEWVPADTLDLSKPLHFSLRRNGATVQQGDTSLLLFPFDVIIEYISRFFTLQQGDLIFTGTPKGVDAVQIGDMLEGYFGEKKLMQVEVK